MPTNTPYDPYTDPKETALALTPLEDADAIQLALSEVVLALAANKIDARRARILIYGLQVASQNHRHRTVTAAKEAENVIAQTVRETHKHEDGTMIGPAKESPDPEEAVKTKRPPSLGEILLREAEAMKAEKEAEEEARKIRQAEEPWEKPQPALVDLKATAEEWSACRSRKKHRNRRPEDSTGQCQLPQNLQKDEFTNTGGWPIQARCWLEWGNLIP